MLKSLLLACAAAIAAQAAGDWTVTDIQVIENTDLTLTGNLIIGRGGSLTLRHANLRFDAAPQGVYRIEAMPGSHLIIEDSSIDAARPDVRYRFAADGAELKIRRSTLDHIGQAGDRGPRSALYVQNSEGFLFEDSTLTHHEASGIVLENSTGAWIHGSTVKRETVDENAHGIDLRGTNHSVIAGNRILMEWGAVTLEGSSYNSVYSNDVVVTKHTLGISIWHGSGYNTVERNHVAAAAGETEACTAFRVVGASLPNYILDNDVDSTWEGVLITYASNVALANNRFKGLTNVETGGIHLYRSHDVQVLNNQITGSTDGLMLIASPRNQIRGNLIEGARYGLAMMKSEGNTIAGNTFSKNRENAVLLDCRSNQVTGNNFYNAGRQAYDLGGNAWSGNYWDDAKGGATYGIEGGASDSAPVAAAIAMVAADIPPMPDGTAPAWRDRAIPVMEDTVWENCEKELSGTLWINSGVTLTIRNCRLTPAAATQNQIGALPGATLRILSSDIGGTGLDSTLSIVSSPGSTLEIRDSKLHYLGDWGGNGGLQIGGDGAVAENNEIVGNYVGVDIRNAGGQRIVNNRIGDCVQGINQGGGAGSVIDGNTLVGCIFSGIMVLNVSSPNRVSGNLVDGASKAIMVQGGGSQIKNNRVQNSNSGIALWDSGSTAAGNALVNNARVRFSWQDGVFQASDSGRNTWDDGARGNYWSDYSGADADGDGIGDSSYRSMAVVDRYPLMRTPDAAPAACAYVLGGSQRTVAADEQTVTVDVITPAGCGWAAASNADWIAIGSGTGIGRGSVTVTVGRNTGDARRIGAVDVAGQTLTIEQAGR